jgi:hypothetical protein
MQSACLKGAKNGPVRSKQNLLDRRVTPVQTRQLLRQSRITQGAGVFREMFWLKSHEAILEIGNAHARIELKRA